MHPSFPLALLLVVGSLSQQEAFLINVPAAAARSAGKVTRGRDTQCSAKEGTLYDYPVSNNGGRVRVVIYDKKLPIDVVKPDNPKEINPQGKVPVFKDEKTGTLVPESDTIVRHLLGRFSEGHGPTYRPSTLEARTKADLIARFHDVYIQPIQGVMYKASPPFGSFDNREDALKELKRQLALLETMVDPEGPYLTGKEKSIADATLFPTGVFLEQILPNHYGWTYQEVFGPKLMKWWDYMLAKEPAYTKVHGEIIKGLQAWEERRRWSTILGADLQDLAKATVFDKILKKEIPASIVYEDDKVLAFNDANPQAPRHILVIPKRRQGLTQLRKATEEQKGILGDLLVAVSKIAAQEKLEGYRVVINDGESAGQSVFHLHLHILSGRPLAWPPG